MIFPFKNRRFYLVKHDKIKKKKMLIYLRKNKYMGMAKIHKQFPQFSADPNSTDFLSDCNTETHDPTYVD